MRQKLADWLREMELDLDEALEEYGHDSVVPAMCTEECEVEPDGICPHGGKSLLLAAGLI